MQSRAEHNRSRSVKEISCTTACHSTAALLQTGTSTSNVTKTFLVGVLFERTLLFRWAWAVTEQNDRVERYTVQWWRLRERGNMNTAGWCGAAYISGCRKFRAFLVNGQNDSLRHIICLNDFLYSSYSRNRFSPKKSYSHSIFQMLFSFSL